MTMPHLVDAAVVRVKTDNLSHTQRSPSFRFLVVGHTGAFFSDSWAPGASDGREGGRKANALTRLDHRAGLTH